MVRLTADWLFSEGFLRVQMHTLPSNDGIHGIARRAGFQREGLLRSYYVERGRPVDAVIFSRVNPNWTR
jgi:RimJ/RimL family protein N-acetyltransferase